MIVVNITLVEGILARLPEREVLTEKINLIKGQNFFEMEELATVVPKRCSSCNGCTKCSDKNYELSKRERRELQLIRENMVLDKENKRLNFKYPLIKDPSVLKDNRMQAIAMATALEKRLKKNDELEVYNRLFKNFLTEDALFQYLRKK